MHTHTAPILTFWVNATQSLPQTISLLSFVLKASVPLLEHRQTDKQTDSTHYSTYAMATASTGKNNNLFNSPLSRMIWVSKYQKFTYPVSLW